MCHVNFEDQQSEEDLLIGITKPFLRLPWRITRQFVTSYSCQPHSAPAEDGRLVEVTRDEASWSFYAVWLALTKRWSTVNFVIESPGTSQFGISFEFMNDPRRILCSGLLKQIMPVNKQIRQFSVVHILFLGRVISRKMAPTTLWFSPHRAALSSTGAVDLNIRSKRSDEIVTGWKLHLREMRILHLLCNSWDVGKMFVFLPISVGCLVQFSHY